MTGGTGSFGRKFIEELLRQNSFERIIIFSRDELKQYEMQQDYPDSEHPQLRYFIGDVRDKERLSRALEGVDVVIHAAALKQVPAAEYNPFEAVKTNIIGAENVIEASIDRGVKKVIALSTDKAAAPINLYGATKLCSDKLFVAANNFRGLHDILFSVVRYGNVMGSRGSVIPYFLKAAPQGTLRITDERMTRFSITLEEGVQFVLKALEISRGGEVFVPRIPSYRILDVAEAVAPGAKRDIVGIRPGEKLHEEMITSSDSLNTVEFEKHYVIVPPTPQWDVEEYRIQHNGVNCSPGFCYDSGNNDHFLTVPEIRELIRNHLDPAFVPFG